MKIISVIVPTFNGGHKIRRLLNSLLAQTVLPHEVVVVIDGSEDNTHKILEESEFEILNLKLVVKNNSGRAISRNRGAEAATGDILIFYDDDMEPQVDSIRKHWDFHTKIDGLVSGVQIEPEGCKSDIQKYKASLSRKWIKKYHEGLNELTLQNLFFTTANCSVRKKQFHVLNGFDERLTDAEDFDFALRALEHGVKVYFDKSSVAIHHDLISCTGYIKRLREYSLAKKEVHRLHQILGLSGSPELTYWRKAFYFPFASSIFPKIVDRINIFLILPKRIRYKFYDVMMYSLSHVYANKRL